MLKVFRLTTFLLWILVSISTGLANESVEPQKLLNLAENMEDFGYNRSAKHYYKQVYKHPKTTSQQRKTLEIKILEIDEKIKKASPTQQLPNLTNISHYNTKPTPSYNTTGVLNKVTPSTNTYPNEFPKSRVNKTKWIITTVAIIGLGLIIHKQISDEHKHVEQVESNTFSLGF